MTAADATEVAADQPAHPAPAAARVLAAVGRLGWGVADQAVSSLSNVAVSLIVIRAVDAASFGAFGLAFVTYAVVLNASRGLATDPLTVRFSGVDRASWRDATAAASGTALVTGTVAGALVLAVGLVLPDPLGPGFVALGLGLPGLMLQDSWRFAFFAAGRGSRALANDTVWTVLLIGALFGLQATGTASVFTCLAVFGGTATLAAGLGMAQTGLLPRPVRARAWLSTHRGLSGRYLVENVSTSGAVQVRSSALGVLAGLAAVGYVRGVEILMGPFLVVLMGISQVAVPEAARVLRRSSRRLMHFCLLLGGGQALGALVWSAALLLVFPHGPGRWLLGDGWAPTSHLVPAQATNVTVACFATAAMAGLRAMGVARRSLRVQLLTAGAHVVCGVAGAALAGAVGLCWGAASANTLAALAGFHQLRAALAARRAAVTGAEVGA